MALNPRDEQKKGILLLALFGDPTVPAGIPNTGGYNQTVKELITQLASDMLQIYIITDASEYSVTPFEKMSSMISLYRIPMKPDERSNQEILRSTYFCIKEAVLDIIQNRIGDIALIHSFYWLSGLIAYCIHQELHIPYIHTPVSLAYNKLSVGEKANCQFQIECEPLFLHGADLLFAISPQEKRILIDHYCISPDKIHITGRSIDSVYYSPTRDRDGTPRNTNIKATTHTDAILNSWWSTGAFTYLGRITPIKGILEIIQAWELLYNKYNGSTPPLWIIGGTPAQIKEYRETVLSKVPHLSDYEKIHKIYWWGWLDQVSISTLFLKSSVLVVHSKYEPGGRVVLEALCQGLPVIATPYGFAADYIKNGINGFLVSFGDIANLARYMENFIRQPYLSFCMGAAAKKTYQIMAKDWGYIQQHRNIYHRYIEQKLPKSRQQDLQSHNIYTDIISKIDIFPYTNIEFSPMEWKQEALNIWNINISEVHKLNLKNTHAAHFIANNEIDSFHIKQFYTRIAFEPLWNSYAKQLVFERKALAKAARASTAFSSVVPIIYFSESGSYYVIKHFRTIKPTTAEALYRIIWRFSQSINVQTDMYKDCIWEKTHAFSLEKCFQELFSSSLQMPDGISLKLLAYRKVIELLLQKSHSDSRFGINYGKAISNHIVENNDKGYALLPTSFWYWGELGADFADISLICGEPPQALPTQSGVLRQQLWLLNSIWKKILHFEWMGHTIPVYLQKGINRALQTLGLEVIFLE